MADRYTKSMVNVSFGMFIKAINGEITFNLYGNDAIGKYYLDVQNRGHRFRIVRVTTNKGEEQPFGAEFRDAREMVRTLDFARLAIYEKGRN